METRTTRILFVCPDIEQPSGGIKQIYRQVDILSQHGYDAYILHKRTGFRCSWFQNSTPVLYNFQIFEEINALKKTKNDSFGKRLRTNLKKAINFIKDLGSDSKPTEITNEDILVLPETFGKKITELRPRNKKVIYNQGAYQTFFGYDLDLSHKETPYLDQNLIAVLVNSEDAKQYMELAFPQINVFRVKYGFDHHKFSYPPKKKKQIAFMTRRLHADIVQVINILKFRGVLRDWELRPIENMNESQVAQCMKESAVFLSFNINEGFGMPPAEAMACGCIVVGYPGFGGIEIFKDEFSYSVPDRDVQAFVRTLEKVIQSYGEDPLLFNEKSKMASEFILNNYSLDEENRTVLEAWNEIYRLLGGNGS